MYVSDLGPQFLEALDFGGRGGGAGIGGSGCVCARACVWTGRCV